MEEKKKVISLMGMDIKISELDLLSLTDLVRLGKNLRARDNLPTFNLTAWMNRKSTKLFVQDLSVKFKPVLLKEERSDQWGHPFVFINLAMDIIPDFKLDTIDWLHAYVMNYRNVWVDSYKKMVGYLYVLHKNSQTFPTFIAETHLKINKACNITDWNDATTQQHVIRRKIETNISMLCEIMTDAELAVDLGIEKTHYM